MANIRIESSKATSIDGNENNYLEHIYGNTMDEILLTKLGFEAGNNRYEITRDAGGDFSYFQIGTDNKKKSIPYNDLANALKSSDIQRDFIQRNQGFIQEAELGHYAQITAIQKANLRRVAPPSVTPTKTQTRHVSHLAPAPIAIITNGSDVSIKTGAQPAQTYCLKEGVSPTNLAPTYADNSTAYSQNIDPKLRKLLENTTIDPKKLGELVDFTNNNHGYVSVTTLPPKTKLPGSNCPSK